MTVYIPTMNRHSNLRKIIPFWLEQGIPVRLVVEPREYSAHNILCYNEGWEDFDVEVIRVPRPGKGIGYARRFCVTHADRSNLASIIMSDDDMRPVTGCDMWPLLDEAVKPGVLGVGAVRSIHDFFTGGAVSRHSGVILCPGGWGFQLFGLNVQTAIDVGNFDAALHSYGEDTELAREGIVRGIPWRVHCDVKCAPIGVRLAPGGISTRFASPDLRTRAERECHAIIHERWPDYVNRSDGPIRVSWQKMLDDYIPDWRLRSAIHDGCL